MKNAVVYGATGLVGSQLTILLLNNTNYEKVYTVVRKSTGLSHSKLIEINNDYTKLSETANLLPGADVFCCLGTTSSKTKDRNMYRQIDYGYPVEIANLAAKNQSESYAVVSSIGASEKSGTFYLKTKGDMERDVLLAGVNKTYIVRPSILAGNRAENRIGEKIGLAVMTVAGYALMGSWKKYRAINAKTVAAALIYLVTVNPPEKQVYESDEVESFGQKYLK